MIALPEALRAALIANGETHREVQRTERAEPDPEPILKLFNPVGAATWIAVELGADGDTLFGLADLGFGCPELGYFSLSEIGQVRLPFGLGIERDEDFRSIFPLSVWADAARRWGSIIHAETMLRRAEPPIPPGP
jgi:hypothetical protein